MNKKISKEIISLLREIIPNPQCELEYSNMFELLVAVMLSAQTTDKRVNIVTRELFIKYPTPFDLMHANYDDVFVIISSVGLAKNKTKNLIGLAKCICEKYNSIVPNSIDELILIPGVGRKTANVILAEGFKIPAFPVDTHVHRIGYRLGYYKKTSSVIDAEKILTKYIPKEDWIDGHHLFLLFGRYHCTALNPKCTNCKLSKYCKEKKLCD